MRPRRRRALADRTRTILCATVVFVVEVSGGAVRVNGRVVPGPYVLAPPEYALPPVRVPAGHVFLPGDNRNDSLDVHVWGFLPEKALPARAFLRYWPPWRVGTL